MATEVPFRFHQYQVVGRHLPTEAEPEPTLYRMKVWAPDSVKAKSKFWYFLRRLRRVKKANGQIVSVNELHEARPTTVKNYGIWVRYQSRTGYHNAYKEYRETTLNAAVDALYAEMASRHRVRYSSLFIIKTATVPAASCRRANTIQFHDSKIRFPVTRRTARPSAPEYRTLYKASRPNVAMR